MTDISDAIETNAQQPKKVVDDRQSVEHHSIPDQIKADDHVNASTAAGRNHMGLRFTRLVPPAAGGQANASGQ